MVVLEPDDTVLWPRVRALTGWIESNEDTLRLMAEAWLRTGQRYLEAARYDVAALGEGWRDAVGVAFATRTGRHLRTVAVIGSEMIELARRADVFATEVALVKQWIVNLVAANVGTYQAIEASIPAHVVPAAQAAFVRQLAAEVQSRVTEAAGRIAASGGAPLGRPGGPPQGATPAEVRQWWDGLTWRQQALVKRESPDLIRNLDGIPATVRHEANRAVLQRELDGLLAREAVLLEEARRKLRFEILEGPPSELYQVQEKIKGLQAIQSRLGLNAYVEPSALLLGFDTTGDGTAVIALGDPDTADNVATLVPGVETTLGWAYNEIDRAQQLWYAADAAVAGNSATSVIAWIGYDTPDMFPYALDQSYAAAAKGPLDRFQDGLRATHLGEPSRNTVIGHSYGSTVIGHAGRDESLAADQVVLVSSPGTGVDHVSGIRLDNVPAAEMGQRVFATTPANDPIHLANIRLNAAEAPGAQPYLTDDLVLGLDPTDPEYGARVFESDLTWNPSRAHIVSFDHGNQALTEMGQIIAGKR
ncbi:alpha/beta hydrolase [Plantactinospora sp. CA-290183]|uniref:alpha/beta hydrolase n=1 Tax=Plantactinospora sp. CA-290183 TaxID=3240006 RepID=UPI003D93CDB7